MLWLMLDSVLLDRHVWLSTLLSPLGVQFYGIMTLLFIAILILSSFSFLLEFVFLIEFIISGQLEFKFHRLMDTFLFAYPCSTQFVEIWS